MKKNEGITTKVGRDGTVKVPTKIIDHLGLNVDDTVSFDVIDVGTVLVTKYTEE